MADGELTEYETLAAEYRRMAGPLEYLVGHVQDGIELEDFAATRAGKVMIGRACHGIKAALDIILDPSAKQIDVQLAITELRVQHRVLASFSETIAAGRQAQRTINQNHDPVDEPEETT